VIVAKAKNTKHAKILAMDITKKSPSRYLAKAETTTPTMIKKSRRYKQVFKLHQCTKEASVSGSPNVPVRSLSYSWSHHAMALPITTATAKVLIVTFIGFPSP
jgi:hypothetical protein